MKIVCDACSAKYSIADEKVRGKVFKIRCKKCSNIIVVRGTTPEGQPQFEQKETKVFDYSGYDNPSAAAAAQDGGEWHIVVDQEQIGPLTEAEVAERFQRGEIDGESYVWREGFADWERLAAVDAFASLGAGGAASASDDAAAAMFGGPPLDESGTVPQSDPGDLFAAASGETDDEPGADLFGEGIGAAMAKTMSVAGGQEDESLFGGGNGHGAGAAAAAAVGEHPDAGDQGLTRQRNENSVLFSLNNLAALASDAPKLSAGPSAPAGMSAAPGAGVTEGSGLIDIRSMAQVYLGEKSGTAASGAPASGSIDDLPVFSQASFEAASPVLLPAAAPANNNKVIFALIGAIGVLAVAAIVLVVVVLKSDSQPKVAAADPGSPGAMTDVAGSAAIPDTPPSAEPDPEGSATELAATAEELEEKPSAEATPAAARREPPKPAPAKTERVARAAPERRAPERERREPPARQSATERASSDGGCDEVSCLVDPSRACCRKFRSSSGGQASRGGGGGSSGGGAASGLPEQPTRAQVQSGMGRVQGRVAACGSRHNYQGTVTVRVRIGPDGKVQSASVAKGGGGAVNGCVTSAVRGASFPRTQRGVTVSYPFPIR